MDSIKTIARQLTDIRQNMNESTDGIAWASAHIFIQNYEILADELVGVGISPSLQNITKAIRSITEYQGFGSDWLAQAKRTSEIFPDIFNASGKKQKLSYHHYRDIANSGCPNKNEIREWAEESDASHSQLRVYIRGMKEKDPSRPDFELKVSNHWKFNSRSVPNLFDGGVHPSIIANLLHYYTNCGDIVIDPMAGSGTTGKVIDHYKYFQYRHPEQPFSGRRCVLMSDILPTSEDIVQADALESLPYRNSIAKLVILDPPYFGIANGKYPNLGVTIDEWRQNIHTIMKNCIRVLVTGGSLAVITDDYNRSDGHYPLSAFTMLAGLELGLKPSGTIYNPFPNFIYTMNGAQMNRAKNARVQVNEMKVIHIFTVIN